MKIGCTYWTLKHPQHIVKRKKYTKVFLTQYSWLLYPLAQISSSLVWHFEWIGWFAPQSAIEDKQTLRNNNDYSNTEEKLFTLYFTRKKRKKYYQYIKNIYLHAFWIDLTFLFLYSWLLQLPSVVLWKIWNLLQVCSYSKKI